MALTDDQLAAMREQAEPEAYIDGSYAQDVILLLAEIDRYRGDLADLIAMYRSYGYRPTHWMVIQSIVDGTYKRVCP